MQPAPNHQHTCTRLHILVLITLLTSHFCLILVVCVGKAENKRQKTQTRKQLAVVSLHGDSPAFPPHHSHAPCPLPPLGASNNNSCLPALWRPPPNAIKVEPLSESRSVLLLIWYSAHREISNKQTVSSDPL